MRTVIKIMTCACFLSVTQSVIAANPTAYTFPGTMIIPDDCAQNWVYEFRNGVGYNETIQTLSVPPGLSECISIEQYNDNTFNVWVTPANIPPELIDANGRAILKIAVVGSDGTLCYPSWITQPANTLPENFDHYAEYENSWGSVIYDPTQTFPYEGMHCDPMYLFCGEHHSTCFWACEIHSLGHGCDCMQLSGGMPCTPGALYSCEYEEIGYDGEWICGWSACGQYETMSACEAACLGGWIE
jgi:hypothetical protein